MRLPLSRATRTICATLACLASAWMDACTTFDDPTTVKDLRILAVSAEPSEIILDLSAIADLSDPALADAIPTISLTPMIVDPRAEQRAVTLTITACANDPGAAAPPNNPGDPTNFPSGGASTTVGSALCDASPSRLVIAEDVPWDINAASLGAVEARLSPAWLLQAFKTDVFKTADGSVHGGFDLGMPVVFQVSAKAGNETLTAIKRVVFWSHSVRDDQRPNTAPHIGGITAYATRNEQTAEPDPADVRSVDEGTAFAVGPQGVWIDPAMADAEAYVTATLDRVTGAVVPHDVSAETITYSFYASAGTFSPPTTSSQPGPGVSPQRRIHIESKYHPPTSNGATGSPDDVSIWIITRDERAGVSWQTRTLRVGVGGGSP